MFKSNKNKTKDNFDVDNIINLSSFKPKEQKKGQHNWTNRLNISSKTSQKPYYKKLSVKDYIMFILFLLLCFYLFYLCSSPI